MIDLDAIRARDRDYDDVFEAQANMSKDIAHRLVAWPVHDRRALLAEVDRLRLVVGDSHPGYIIGMHWMAAAYARMCAGEDEARVMRDYGYALIEEAGP